MTKPNPDIVASRSEYIVADHTLTEKPKPFDFHFHEHYEMYFFLSCSGEMMVEQSKYSLSRGSLLVFNSHEAHRAMPAQNQPYERIAVHFQANLIRALPLQNCNLLACFQNHVFGTKNSSLLENETFDKFFYTAKNLIDSLKSSQPEGEALALSYLTQLLVIANHAFSESHEMTLPFSGFVSEAVLYIDSHLSDPLSLQHLAQILNIDPFHLSHQFKLQTGTSPYHYILIKRIALAKQLLSEGLSAIQTCEQAGFGEYNNFSRTFKKYVGITPGNYKKIHKGPSQF
jgi:AraC-type DNA-binding domain-containing proteins